MSRLIKASGEVIELDSSRENPLGLKRLQELVGGYIELVYISGNQYLVIDEEGKLKEKLRNDLATILVESHLLENDYIAGDAIIVTIENSGEDNEVFF